LHFLLYQKPDDLFLVITLSYIFIYCHRLPFYLICGGAPHQIQPHFLLHSNKNVKKNFFVTLGDAPAPPPLPGYAHGWKWDGIPALPCSAPNHITYIHGKSWERKKGRAGYGGESKARNGRGLRKGKEGNSEFHHLLLSNLTTAPDSTAPG